VTCSGALVEALPDVLAGAAEKTLVGDSVGNTVLRVDPSLLTCSAALVTPLPDVLDGAAEDTPAGVCVGYKVLRVDNHVLKVFCDGIELAETGQTVV
jgi:hypothetical protein